MKSPETYQEWSIILDELEKRNNDAEILQAIKRGTLDWQPEVAQRFTIRFANTINSRIDYAADRFRNATRRAYGDERTLVQAMLLLRKELKFLKDVIDIPVIPVEKKQEFMSLVMNPAKSFQSNIEEDARRIDRSGKLAKLVRDHRVDNI